MPLIDQSIILIGIYRNEIVSSPCEGLSDDNNIPHVFQLKTNADFTIARRETYLKNMSSSYENIL